MPTFEQMRATLFEDPNDESPWLIMSDWLMERGDPQSHLYQQRFIENAIGMRFALVPRGRFWMSRDGRNAQEEVEIPRDFYMGVHQVTQRQWAAVMGENPAHFWRTRETFMARDGLTEEDVLNFPVESVSWNDAQEFIKRLNDMPEERAAGRVYSLPTEAMWEYACREARQTKQECSFDFYLGSAPTNSISSTQANFDGRFPAGDAEAGPYLARPTMVGSYRPNRLGLYDMHGNVWEWMGQPGTEPWNRGGKKGPSPTSAAAATGRARYSPPNATRGVRPLEGEPAITSPDFDASLPEGEHRPSPTASGDSAGTAPSSHCRRPSPREGPDGPACLKDSESPSEGENRPNPTRRSPATDGTHQPGPSAGSTLRADFYRTSESTLAAESTLASESPSEGEQSRGPTDPPPAGRWAPPDNTAPCWEDAAGYQPATAAPGAASESPSEGKQGSDPTAPGGRDGPRPPDRAGVATPSQPGGVWGSTPAASASPRPPGERNAIAGGCWSTCWASAWGIYSLAPGRSRSASSNESANGGFRLSLHEKGA